MLKIVYYGADGSGKRTNMEYLYNRLRHHTRSQLIQLKTHTDRMLFFDLHDSELDSVNGFDIKIRLYTAPGPVKYNATRKLLLKEADGIVFVADSVAMRRESNFLSLRNLQENLNAYRKNIFNIPMVFQFNKRDLDTMPLLPLKTMQTELNGRLKADALEASALTGMNVVATLNAIIAQTADMFRDELKRRIKNGNKAKTV